VNKKLCTFLGEKTPTRVLSSLRATPISARTVSLSQTRCSHLLYPYSTLALWFGGCVVECRTCNREDAGSNLGRGYFTPRSTQPSMPPGSVNEYLLRLGRQRQVWLIPLADEMQGVQVKLWYPLTMRVTPERLKRWFMYRCYTNRHYLYLYLRLQYWASIAC